jgi:hypothetical protein
LPPTNDNIATVANDPIDKLRRIAFPNPKRIGCPEPAIFEALKRREVSFDDPVWSHIEECSPCYSQFAEIREALFKKDRRSDLRKASRVGVVIIVLLAVSAGLYIWHRSKAMEGLSAIASNRGEAAVLNFEDGSELRGPPGSPISANFGVQHLRRDQLNLTVYLPLGSPAGEYELDISGKAGDSLWRARGVATIKDGLTSISVAGDLRNVPAGEYKFRFRRIDETWHEKNVLVK